MPELPEVETVVRAIRGSGIIGSPISQVEIKKEFHIKEVRPDDFVNNLLGQTIQKIERKGKWIFFLLEKWGSFQLNRIRLYLPKAMVS